MNSNNTHVINGLPTIVVTLHGPIYNLRKEGVSPDQSGRLTDRWKPALSGQYWHGQDWPQFNQQPAAPLRTSCWNTYLLSMIMEKIFIEIRSSHDTFRIMELPKHQINPPLFLFCINFICRLVVLCSVCFLVTSNTFVNESNTFVLTYCINSDFLPKFRISPYL